MARLYESRRYRRLLVGDVVVCGSTAVRCGPCEGPAAAQGARQRCHPWIAGRHTSIRDAVPTSPELVQKAFQIRSNRSTEK